MLKVAMKALVIYASTYGNTECIAAAIGEGLRSAGAVSVVPVAELEPAREAVELLVVGAPTHRRRAPDETLASLRCGRLPTTARAAVFDTRYPKPRWLTGSASGHLKRMLADAGVNVTARESFFVAGRHGPLLDGELRRAKEWAQELAKRYLP